MDRFLIGGRSEVVVGRGLPDPLLPEHPARRRVAILAQPGAAPIAAAVATGLERAYDTLVIQVPDREEAKTLATLGRVYDSLAEAELGRADTVVGVGGGAVTDLAGFVAATWLRGVEVVHVPTTLLGAVDAAIGGKTAINVAGKNLVGAFWHPSRVAIDLQVLDDLPLDLKREGAAEAIKAGLIADPKILEAYRLGGLEAPADEVVPRAVAVKVAVVSEDFREEGRRAVLNFGHTIGHALETSGGLSHGQAVAVGMVAAGAISEERFGVSLVGEIRDLLERVGLPVEVPLPDRPSFDRLLRLDKKRDSAGLRMVLLEKVGCPVLSHVSSDEVELGVSAIAAR